MSMTPDDVPGPDDHSDTGADTDSDTEPSQPTRERRRATSYIGWGVIAVVVVGVVWVVITALLARSKLNTARTELATLRSAIVSGDTVRASELVDSIRDATSDAHALTTGPAWWVTSNLPVAGSPLRTSRTIAAQVDRLGNDVLPAILRVAKTLPSEKNGALTGIDLSPLVQAAAPVHHATETARDALAQLRATDGSWLPQVATARTSLIDELSQLDGELTGADRAVHIAPKMLGVDGTKRYFIAFMNDAEARGGGGIVGAYAIATATHGKIRFESFGSDSDLGGIKAKVDLGSEFNDRYANNEPYSTIQNVNLSPDFRYAARILGGMWRAKTGEPIDGTIALDPTALSYFLRELGPVTLADGTVVSGDSVVALTQQTLYTRFASNSPTANAERKNFLVGIAKAISASFTSASAKPEGLVRAASQAAMERRLLIWSADKSVEGELEAADWAGATGAADDRPYSGFVVNNAAGNKLDYYLDRRMSYSRPSCSSGAKATATFQMINRAPKSGLSPYVTARGDDPPKSARPGDTRVLLTYYADRDAKITAFTVAGKPVFFVPQAEGDTIAATVTVELPAGQPVTASVTVTEPGKGPVSVLRQPGVRPLEVDIADRCG